MRKSGEFSRSPSKSTFDRFSRASRLVDVRFAPKARVDRLILAAHSMHKRVRGRRAKFLFRFFGNRANFTPSRLIEQGRTRDRHDTWSAGSGGRIESQRDPITRTNDSIRTVKSCGPGAPVLALTLTTLSR